MTSAAAKPLALLFLILAAASGGSGLWLLRQSPLLHDATVSVRVIRDATDVADLGSLAPQGTEVAVFLQNQSEIIRSDTILTPVRNHLLKSRNQLPKAYAPLNKMEATAWLRDRIEVTTIPTDDLLMIRAASEDTDCATEIASEVAQVFCDYRKSRRQRLAQEKIAAVDTSFRENEAKLQSARDLLTSARQRLASEWQAAPPDDKAADETLKKLRSDLNRVTMNHLALTNRLALSQNLPPANREQLEQQVAKSANLLTNTLAAITTAAERQDVLRAYWAAALDVEKVEKIFAPLAALVATNRSIIADTNFSPAQIAAVQSHTKPHSSPLRRAAQGGLVGAGLSLAAAVLVFIQPRKTVPPR